jgi:hypothetical protein
VGPLRSVCGEPSTVVRDTAAATPGRGRGGRPTGTEASVGPRRLLQLSLVLAAAAVLILALTGALSPAFAGMAGFGS